VIFPKDIDVSSERHDMEDQNPVSRRNPIAKF
jgi:hypothetical protein